MAAGPTEREPMSPDLRSATPPWHALPVEEVLRRLGIRSAGLSSAEAAARRARHGPNALLLARPAPWWRILAAQFKGLVVVLLAAVAVVALLLGDVVEAVAVLVVLLINGALGFWMEWRARQAMEALRRLQVQVAVVRRDGRAQSLDARDLVPGDVLELEAGSAVPADARLLEVAGLTAVEAPLTGESAPVAKGVEPVADAAAPLADRTSMVYKGTLAAAGSATAVVVATGRATEVGRVAELVAETETEATPLERRLDALGRRLVGLALGVAAVVTALGVLRGEDPWRMVETGLALAVAAVPEGLPVVATLALAVGMRRMARRNALVRRLPAVETLGSATVICSDKTGTLTAGEMTMTRLVLLEDLLAADDGGTASAPVGAEPARAGVVEGGAVGTVRRESGAVEAARLEAGEAGEASAGELPDGAGRGEIVFTGTGYDPAGELRRGGRRLDAGAVPALLEVLAAGVLANRATLGPAGAAGPAGDEEGGSPQAAVAATAVDGAPAAAEKSAGEGRRTPPPVDSGAWVITGDPTEAALLVAAAKAGLSRERLLAERPRVGEVPFSSERMWMASFHRRPDGSLVAYVKGAPGKVLERSRLAADERRAVLDCNRALAARGLRVLALARRVLPPGTELDEAAVEELELLALAGLSDPPADGAAPAIALFHRAGVRTVMITGDQAVTARAIATELGLLRPGDEMLEGREVAELSDAALQHRVARAAAFCRTSPAQKLRIVDAFQARGEIVAMLGDGVNDAPALKSADIGVAMGGRGTDVAKETAAVVLQDDRFETVAAAVEEGRVIFDNVRKFILFLFSCNLAEVLVLLLAGVAGLPLPLTALQILWLNLLTDVFPALALAVEPAEPDVMERPPRDPAEGLLTGGFLLRVTGYAAAITGATLVAFLVGLGWLSGTGGAGGAASAAASGADGVAGGSVPRGMTMAFVTLALAQLFHVVNARSPRPLLLSRRLVANRSMLAALAATVALQLLAVYLPGLSSVLDTVPLGAGDWAVVLPLSLLPLLLGQASKALLPARMSTG